MLGVKILLNTEATMGEHRGHAPRLCHLLRGRLTLRAPPSRASKTPSTPCRRYTHPDEVQGKKIIIGGGATGCESGYFFASEWGAQVDILEMRDDVCK